VAPTKRCEHCGASNPESAEWCSLCLERFDAPEPEPAPEGEPHLGPAPVPVDGGDDQGGRIATAARLAQRTESDVFQVTEEGIKWVCQTCSTLNDLDVFACTVCGATFADQVRPKVERPARDPSKAALFSLFFPGAGHAYVGMWGQAVARGVLSTWVLLVALVGILDNDVPGSLAMATVFGLVGLALWVIAAHDAFREATNDTGRVLLRGRRFLFVVLGLMALLFVAMFVALMAARNQNPEGPLSISAWPSTSYPISTGPTTG
jgi:ribosomal protein L40E